MLHIRRLQYEPAGWRGRAGLAIAITMALALAIALVVVALGLALILLPVVAIGLVIARWRFNRLMRDRADRTGGDTGRAIEIEYTVVDDRRRR